MSPLPLLLAFILPAFAEDPPAAAPAAPSRAAPAAAPAADDATRYEAFLTDCEARARELPAVACADPRSDACRITALHARERDGARLSAIEISLLHGESGRQLLADLTQRHMAACIARPYQLQLAGGQYAVFGRRFCAEPGAGDECRRWAMFIEAPADGEDGRRFTAAVARPQEGAASRLSRVADDLEDRFRLKTRFFDFGVGQSAVRRRDMVGFFVSGDQVLNMLRPAAR